jgi:hypothetical protein
VTGDRELAIDSKMKERSQHANTSPIPNRLTEPTYFERDRYDLPLPLIAANPNLATSETTVVESEPIDSSSEQKQLIFQALTQVFSPLGVRFEFAIQHAALIPAVFESGELTMLQSPDLALPTMEYRLWVRCHDGSSLDSQLIAEPLARALRSIDLQGFQDAIVQFSRFSGRDRHRLADWRIRVDLTPTQVKLQRWARWGDVQAITRLLDLALAPEGIQVNTAFKNLTLQIFCTLRDPQAAKFPLRKTVVDTIAPLLISLSPQGLQGATIHGMAVDNLDESPTWMHWLDLPGLSDPKFSPTPIILAARGDEGALNFVLERLLNPDLDRWCELGGIELSLLCRQRLLHVMSEAPICPIQSQIATIVVKVLKQLALPGVKGARVHGRIAGQSIAQWTYGLDFEPPALELSPAAIAEQFTIDDKSVIPKIGIGQQIRDYLIGTGIWKPQLAMDATSQLAYHPRFQWQPSLLLLLVGLGVASIGDLAVRFRLEAKNLTATTTEATTQLSFNNPLLEQKLAQYQLRCLQHGVPDVLIVGSSRALRGIDPAALQQNIDLQGKNNKKTKKVEIYNFGINGATAQLVDLVLRELLTSQQLPKLVIWADGARAFNSGRVDRTYETIALSERYRQLALISGLNNSNSSLLQAQSSLRNTYQSIDSKIDRKLAQVSPAYHHRDLLKGWLQTRIPPLMPLAPADASTAALGININERDIDFNGFLPLELKFDPSTYFDKYTKVSGESDGDYANFQLSGNQDRAVQRTIELLAARKISLVFVNMPLSNIYLDKFRSDREVMFENYMQNLMAARQLTFVNLNNLLTQKYDRFSDPSHLNQFGAIDVSRYLASTAEISWQQILLGK